MERKRERRESVQVDMTERREEKGKERGRMVER